MTEAKTIGRILLWVLRLGLFLLGPMFLWLTCLTFYGPFRPALLVPGIVTLALTAAAVYIGWRCDLAFPIERPQTDHPRLPRWGMALAAASASCLILNLGLTQLHSAAVASNNGIGATMYFVADDIFTVFLLLSFLLSGAVVLLWLISLVKNTRQLRMMSWLTAFVIIIYPTMVSTLGLIDANKGEPLWEIEETATGPDKQTYYFLNEGLIKNDRSRSRRFVNPDTFSALARRTGGNSLIGKAEIILSDMQSQDPHGALLEGTKHSDPVVAQVSEKLLKLHSH